MGAIWVTSLMLRCDHKDHFQPLPRTYEGANRPACIKEAKFQDGWVSENNRWFCAYHADPVTREATEGETNES